MVWRNAGGICERKTLFRMKKISGSSRVSCQPNKASRPRWRSAGGPPSLSLSLSLRLDLPPGHGVAGAGQGRGMALQASRPHLSPSPSLLLWPLMVLVPGASGSRALGGAAVGTEQSQVLPFPLVFWDFAFASLIRPFDDFDSCSRV